MYIKVARLYLQYINWSLHNRLVSNILENLFIWAVNNQRSINNNCGLILYANWDHRYCDKPGLVVKIIDDKLNTLLEPGS